MKLRVAIYARVSTDDKEQNPETQLMPCLEFAQVQGWEVIYQEADHASAVDMRRRVGWRRLMDHALWRRYDVLLVFRLDRAFRSVLDGATTLEKLRHWKVAIRSLQEPYIDTTAPWGEVIYHMTIVWAQLSRQIHVENVRAGMNRAMREGKHVGRPRRIAHPEAYQGLDRVQELIDAGVKSQRQAAKMLGVSPRTLRRYLAQKASVNDDGV